MPGYVIHLAVAEQYLKKHKETKEDYNEFIEGVIFPDNVEDKSKTHYGVGSANSNLYKFLQDKNIETSFNRGHFLHLLTDYIFYNRYIEAMSKEIIYNDYDLLNKELIEKYNVNVPDKIKSQVFHKEKGTLKILSRELVDKLIEDVSNLDIFNVAKETLEKPEKWTKTRPLKEYK